MTIWCITFFAFSLYFIVASLYVLTTYVTVCVCHAELKGNLPAYLTVVDRMSALCKGFCEKFVLNNNNNNNKRQFVRRRNMSVDITRAPYRQSGNVVRDSSTETRL